MINWRGQKHSFFHRAHADPKSLPAMLIMWGDRDAVIPIEQGAGARGALAWSAVQDLRALRSLPPQRTTRNLFARGQEVLGRPQRGRSTAATSARLNVGVSAAHCKRVQTAADPTSPSLGIVIESASSVTLAVWASARPVSFDPEVMVTADPAITVP